MAHAVDTDLLRRIKGYGAFDISACFNCGNCTAVCPLSKGSDNFPRRLIRYGQLGMEDRLLSNKQLWLCYYCGECSDTCPREADPGEYMAAARRYAISRYDKTGIGRLLYGSTWGHVAFFLLLSAFFTVFLLWHRGTMNDERFAFFDFIPGKVIHDVGIALFVLIGAGLILGVGSMARRFLRAQRAAGRPANLAWSALPSALAYAIRESLGQARYRECDAEKPQPWYLRPWFVHLTILWGFLGLLAATTWDFLFKPIGTYVPLWSPGRLLGTVAGVVALYGLSVAGVRRWRKDAPPYASSRFSDWFFLGLMFATVLTGFWAEIVVYLPVGPELSYVGTLVHVVLAMDLVVLLPVTKFAHAVYRPLALLLDRWTELGEELATKRPTTAAEAS